MRRSYASSDKFEASRVARPRRGGPDCYEGGAHRRPPPLEPLERLGADERDGDEDEDDGRVTPCDGALGRTVVELPDPLLVDGFVWVDEPELLDPDEAPLELPAPVDGATASLLPRP